MTACGRRSAPSPRSTQLFKACRTTPLASWRTGGKAGRWAGGGAPPSCQAATCCACTCSWTATPKRLWCWVSGGRSVPGMNCPFAACTSGAWTRSLQRTLRTKTNWHRSRRLCSLWGLRYCTCVRPLWTGLSAGCWVRASWTMLMRGSRGRLSSAAPCRCRPTRNRRGAWKAFTAATTGPMALSTSSLDSWTGSRGWAAAQRCLLSWPAGLGAC